MIVVLGTGTGYLIGVSNRDTTTVVSTTTTTFTTPSGSPIPISSLLTGDVTVGGAPRLIAVDSLTHRVYVTDWFSENVSVIDALSHTLLATIVLPGSSNSGIAIDPGTDVIYVSVAGCINRVNATNSCNANPPPTQEGGIVEINGTTNTIMGELHHPVGVGDLAFNPSTHILYGYSSSLLAIDVRTGSVVANISLNIAASGIAVDPSTNMVYVAGCKGDFFCDSELAIVNGSTEGVQSIVHLGFGTYPRVSLNQATHEVYVSGDARIVAINGTSGATLFDARTGTCAVLDGLGLVQSSNQILAVSLNLDYLLVYDGNSGTLANMYASSSEPQYAAYNNATQEIYITLFSGHLLSFHDVNSIGNANGGLIGPGNNCPLP